jgi:glycosyltransferase involved in cell wall biosynthesis
MRALFVCPNLNGNGAERHWSILLPGLNRREIGVSLATLDGRGEFFAELVRDRIPARCFADSGARAYPQALRAMRRSRQDVIVTRGTSAHGLAMIASRRSRTKWVVNWHRPSGLELTPRRTLILRQILGSADAVIAVSESQIAELSRFGVRDEAIRVIHNGTDFATADGARERLRQELGVGEQNVVVLLAGRLDAQKRVDVFIDAITVAQRQNPSVVGLIAGAGSLESTLRGRADASGANVRFLGRREDMPAVLAAADTLALTSDREALPYIVLEGMASGLPVIATRVGAVPEVVTADVGITTPVGDVGSLADAMLSLAGDPARRSQLGEGARRKQRGSFSADAMCDAYARALQEIVA